VSATSTFSHFVPRFHLRWFCAPEGELGQPRFAWALHRGTRGWRRFDPDSEGGEEGFYRVLDESDQPSDWLEKELQKKESQTANAIRRLASERKLPEGRDREAIAWFVATQLVRTPRFRSSVEWSTEDMRRALQSTSQTSGRSPGRIAHELRATPTPHIASWAKRILTPRVTERAAAGSLSDADKRQIRIALSFANVERFATTLLDMKLIYLLTASPACFVTSDHPVQLSKNREDSSVDSLRALSVEFTCPIANSLAVLASWNAVSDDVCPLPIERVELINRRTADHAEQFIVAPSTSCPGVPEIAERFQDGAAGTPFLLEPEQSCRDSPES